MPVEFDYHDCPVNVPMVQRTIKIDMQTPPGLEHMLGSESMPDTRPWLSVTCGQCGALLRPYGCRRVFDKEGRPTWEPLMIGPPLGAGGRLRT